MADTALAELREQALRCRNCPLFADATQTVFGEGPAPSELMFVGEAPGDQEDRQGRPFVGPAGQLLDRALEEAGIDRSRIYLTNAVKHFKFVLRGRRRIHQKPDRSEIEACKLWLLGEIDLVQPRLIVAMGATAAQALMGRVVTIGRERGRFQHYPPDRHLLVTVHPSFLLRVPDERAKAMEYARFVRELQMIAEGPPVPAEEPEAARPDEPVVAQPAAAMTKGTPAPEAGRKSRRGGRKASGGEGQFSLF